MYPEFDDQEYARLKALAVLRRMTISELLAEYARICMAEQREVNFRELLI